MNFFGKIFGKAQPDAAAAAPREFVDMLGRFARSLEESVHTATARAPAIPLAPAARQLLDYLRTRREPGLFRYDEYPTVLDMLIGTRHPAEVLAELHTGLVTFRLNEFDQRASHAYLFGPVMSHMVSRLAGADRQWALSKDAYSHVMAVHRWFARSKSIDSFGCLDFLTAIVERALATGDGALREDVRELIQDVVSAEPCQTLRIVAAAKGWREAAGFARADIPFLRQADADGEVIKVQRLQFCAAAGAPLGDVLRQIFDGEVKIGDKLKGQTPEFDALLGGSKELRGAALTFLLDRILTGKTYDDHARFVQRGEHWAQEFNPHGRVRPPLDYLAFELAKRGHVLADPDRTHARVVTLLQVDKPGYRRETSRLILKEMLSTVRAHPQGATATALVELGNEYRYSEWRGDIEKAVREGLEARADGVGTGTGTPPRELPVFLIGSHRDEEAFARYCADLFDPRLYAEPHDSYIRQVAEFGQMVAEAQAAGEANAAIGPRIFAAMQEAGVPVRIAYGNPPADFVMWAHCYFDAAMRAHEQRETLRPMIAAYPDLGKELAALADEIMRKTVPTAKWLAAARAFVAKVPQSVWVRQLHGLSATNAPGSNRNNGIGPEHYLRTLIYFAAFLPAAEVGPLLVQYALKKCYVTEPGIGIRSEKLGNACVWALAALPDGAGVPYLARILARTKYPKIRKKIDEQLNAAATAAGVSRADLDEVTVPTHDLDREGRRVAAFESGTATLIAEGSTARIEWANAQGKPVKSATAAIKANKGLMKELQADLKELQADLSIQPQRLQRLYVQDRCWPAAVWRERYLEQPLMRGFARRLVWQIAHEGHAPVTALPDAAGEGLLDCGGKAVPLDGATIRLWHPMMSPVEEVEAWRLRLEELRVTQPFAQAWREVYALTDAERATATYSNRWAAHILKQQQAMNLARLNGWTVTGRVWFDTANDQPWHLHLPEHGLVAEYWVEGAGGDDPETTDSGAYAYVNTDRVTFFRAIPGAADSARGPSTGDPLPLAGIPPVVFSEVMRACDLFTAVASIAADPTWLDRGQEAQHPSQWGQATDTYWRNVNTGDLVESGKRRHAMLARIVPRLAIADKLSLSDKALVVRGTRHTYEIHLGSGAASRNGRHICIVPKNTAMADRVWLPFEGDRTLSIIISKAVLLAADDKITDPVILGQI